MTKHKAPQPGHRRAPEARHRAPAKPRYGRIAALSSSVAVTVVAVLGSAGAFPSSVVDDIPSASADAAMSDVAALPSREVQPGPVLAKKETGRERVSRDLASDFALPRESGEGRRIVFSESEQRVWLVGKTGKVRSSYRVSGSIEDNLDPGTYEVYSKSRHAVGIDDSGTMEYFVRFTKGPSGAAIGFHTIPLDDGEPVQTLDELGTPLSHGCIRQRTRDAIALWDFAPIGTTVVVTA